MTPHKNPNSRQHLLLPTCKGIEVIDITNIIRIEAVSSYSKLYFINGKTLVVAKVLHWVEERLSSRQFIRVHRTHVVNRNFIHQYLRKTNKIKLLNGECIDVARRKKAFFLKCWLV